MKKILILILSIFCLTQCKTYTAEEIRTAEAMFPNAVHGMKTVKFCLITNIQDQKIHEAYCILAASNEYTLQYLFADNPILSNFISEFLTEENQNILHLACKNNDSVLAKTLYSHDKTLLRKYDNSGKSPLYYAFKYNFEFIDYVREYYDSYEEFVSREDLDEIYQLPTNYFRNKEKQNLFNTIH